MQPDRPKGVPTGPPVPTPAPPDDKDLIVTLAVAEGAGGVRLDRFLVGTGRFSSRGEVHRLIREGKVTVAGRPAKPAYKLKPSQPVVVRVPPAKEAAVQAEPLPLHILYEDEDLIVVDKPAGMVVHPASGNESGTLVNALLYHCGRLSQMGGPRRPGIVHRLDKDTSGVLVAAKSDRAYIGLARQFQRHSVLREYVGLVAGTVSAPSGSVEKPIGRHPVERKKMSTRSTRGKHALTRWAVERRFSRFTLLRFSLETGRTHQIRVHMAEIGHPIVGDHTYGRHWASRAAGGGRAGDEISLIRSVLDRPFLHAERLGFSHPAKGVTMVFSAPLPEELKKVLNLIEPTAVSSQ